MAAAGRTDERDGGQRSSARSRPVELVASRLRYATARINLLPGDRRSLPPARYGRFPGGALAPAATNGSVALVPGLGRLDLDEPHATVWDSSTPSRRGGARLVDEARNARRRSHADELRHDATVAIRLRRDPLHAVLGGKARVRVDVDLRQLDGARALSTSRSSTGVSARHGPHQAAQKTITGVLRDSSTTSRSKVSSVTSAPCSGRTSRGCPIIPNGTSLLQPVIKRPGRRRARYPRAQDVPGRSRLRASSRPRSRRRRSEPNR